MEWWKDCPHLVNETKNRPGRGHPIRDEFSFCAIAIEADQQSWDRGEIGPFACKKLDCPYTDRPEILEVKTKTQ